MHAKLFSHNNKIKSRLGPSLCKVISVLCICIMCFKKITARVSVFKGHFLVVFEPMTEVWPDKISGRVKLKNFQTGGAKWQTQTF